MYFFAGMCRWQDSTALLSNMPIPQIKP